VSPPDSAHTVPEDKFQPLVKINNKRQHKLRNRKLAAADLQRSGDGEEEEGLIIAVDDFEKMSNLNISEIQPDSMH
jgi:hypothetical protein